MFMHQLRIKWTINQFDLFVIIVSLIFNLSCVIVIRSHMENITINSFLKWIILFPNLLDKNRNIKSSWNSAEADLNPGFCRDPRSPSPVAHNLAVNYNDLFIMFLDYKVVFYKAKVNYNQQVSRIWLFYYLLQIQRDLRWSNNILY